MERLNYESTPGEQYNPASVIMNSTFDILEYRYNNLGSNSNFSGYRKVLENEAFKINSLYTNNSEDLFFNGYVNEAAFLAAYKICFNNDTDKIAISNADEDCRGIDFRIGNGNGSLTALDVTISKKAYAHRLSQPRKNVLLLPVVDPKNETYFTELLLRDPSLENFIHYLSFTAGYNERILNNQKTHKFNIEILKNGEGLKPNKKTFRKNGNEVYDIQIAEEKYRKISCIIEHLKSPNS